jgi:hypothetical protein
MTLAGFLSDAAAVRVSSIAGLIAIPAYATAGLKRARSLRHAPGFSVAGVLVNLACATIAFIAFASCAAGFPAGRLTAVYLVALMGMLGSSAIMFSLVIVSMLRTHER